MPRSAICCRLAFWQLPRHLRPPRWRRTANRRRRSGVPPEYTRDRVAGGGHLAPDPRRLHVAGCLHTVHAAEHVGGLPTRPPLQPSIVRRRPRSVSFLLIVALFFVITGGDLGPGHRLGNSCCFERAAAHGGGWGATFCQKLSSPALGPFRLAAETPPIPVSHRQLHVPLGSGGRRSGRVRVRWWALPAQLQQTRRVRAGPQIFRSVQRPVEEGALRASQRQRQLHQGLSTGDTPLAVGWRCHRPWQKLFPLPSFFAKRGTGPPGGGAAGGRATGGGRRHTRRARSLAGWRHWLFQHPRSGTCGGSWDGKQHGHSD